MAKEYQCKSCRKTFPTKKALKQHNRSKHRLQGLLLTGSYLAVFALITGFLAYSGALSYLIEVIQSPPYREGEIQMHIHSELAIVIDGESVIVPSDIGMRSEFWRDRSLDRYGESGMSPIHTRDDSGKIHVESTVVRDYTLGEFFDVWGVQFNATCIMFRCVDDTYSLEVFVNGEKNFDFRDHVLGDGEQILLAYRKS